MNVMHLFFVCLCCLEVVCFPTLLVEIMAKHNLAMATLLPTGLGNIALVPLRNSRKLSDFPIYFKYKKTSNILQGIIPNLILQAVCPTSKQKKTAKPRSARMVSTSSIMALAVAWDPLLKLINKKTVNPWILHQYILYICRVTNMVVNVCIIVSR